MNKFNIIRLIFLGICLCHQVTVQAIKAVHIAGSWVQQIGDVLPVAYGDHLCANVVQYRVYQQEGNTCAYHAIDNSGIRLKADQEGSTNLGQMLHDVDAIKKCIDVSGYDRQNVKAWRSLCLQEKDLKDTALSLLNKGHPYYEIHRTVLTNICTDLIPRARNGEQMSAQVIQDMFRAKLGERNKPGLVVDLDPPVVGEQLLLLLTNLSRRISDKDPRCGVDLDVVEINGLREIKAEELNVFVHKTSIVADIDAIGNQIVGIDPIEDIRNIFAESIQNRTSLAHAFVIGSMSENQSASVGHWDTVILYKNQNNELRFEVLDSMNINRICPTSIEIQAINRILAALQKALPEGSFEQLHPMAIESAIKPHVCVAGAHESWLEWWIASSLMTKTVSIISLIFTSIAVKKLADYWTAITAEADNLQTSDKVTAASYYHSLCVPEQRVQS